MTMLLKRNGPMRRAACAMLIALLTGCTTLQPVASPAHFIPAAQPNRIGVTRADSSKVLMEGPRLLGDTLVGWVAGRYEEIPLPEARWVSVRQPASRRTMLLVGAVVAVGAVMISMVASGGTPTAPPNPEQPPTSSHP
jgi:hypothetical protein